MIRTIYDLVDSKKAEDITVIDFKNHHPLYDHFVIATVANDKMAAAIVKVLGDFAKENSMNTRVEGKNSEWTLIDLGDVVVHLFTPQSRQFYSLESLFDASFVVDLSV